MLGPRPLLGASLLVFLQMGLCNLSAAQIFQPAQSYQTAAGPSSVAIADFNGDLKPDLAVTNAVGANGNGSVSILLGNGDGTFQPATSFASQGNPRSIAAADFNGDLKQDLALITDAGDVVTVLLGNGDGTFGTTTTFASATNPTSLAVGDFNGDNNPDLAVSCSAGAAISVLRGNGDGTFQSHVDYPSGPANAVLTADVNNDAKVDLIASRLGGLSILLGNGDGTFQPALFQAAATFTLRPFAADFNRDDKVDAVMGFTSIGSTRAGSRLILLFGNGDGTFRSSPAFGSGFAITAADFNGDRKPDVVAATSVGLDLLLGNGDGTFQMPLSFTAGASPSFAATADLDGDKAPDLVVANSGDNTVSVLLNTDSTDFSISASPLSPSTVSRGHSATSTLTLSLLNSFVNPVALACTVQPSGSGAPSCSLNPSSVTFDSSGNATTTLTVNTGAAAASLSPSYLQQPPQPLYSLWLPVAGLALLGVGLGSGYSMRRAVLMFLTGVLLAALALQVGCGGDNGSSQNGGSQTGTFAVTVSATSGTTVRATTLNLTVR